MTNRRPYVVAGAAVGAVAIVALIVVLVILLGGDDDNDAGEQVVAATSTVGPAAVGSPLQAPRRLQRAPRCPTGPEARTRRWKPSLPTNLPPTTSVSANKKA